MKARRSNSGGLLFISLRLPAAAAQYNLGINYYEGTGVSQNKEEAKKWLRKAANQGYENAKQYLKKWFGEE